MARLRKEGWTVAVVERWNPHANVRVDLFNIIDLLAMRPGSKFTLGVQACAASGVASHITKLIAEPRTAIWLDAEANRILQVWGWSMRGKKGQTKKWTRRRVSIRLVCGKVVPQEIPEISQ
jgi:hypothetical protein